MRTSTKAALCACAAVLALHGTTAFAQEQQASPTDDVAATGDIIVTAQKRSERLQDIPASIVAISGDTLASRGLTSVVDVLTQAPNVRYQSPTGVGGAPIFNIRGVTLLDFSDTNEPSVSLYSDDVYVGNPSILNQQLFDTERVEILRGPQGTLYGRNATGGLINFISRRPTDHFEALASAEYGSYDNVIVDGALSGPITAGLRARLAGRFQRNDGYQVNLFNGQRLNKIDHAVALRGTLELDATDTLMLRASAHYSDFKGREDGRSFYGKRRPGNLAASCTLGETLASLCANALGFRDPAPDPRRVYTADLLPVAMKNYGGYLRGELDLGFGQLTSITGYEHALKTDTIDADGAPNSSPNVTVGYYSKHRQFSQEIRLGGESGRLNWLAGAYYYTDTRFYTTHFLRLGNLGNFADQKVDTVGLFTQNSFAITDTLNFTGGVRFTHETRDLRELGRVNGGTPGTRLGTRLFTYSDSISLDKVTWRAALDWKVTPDILLFTSVSTGFKSGAFNTQLVSAISGVGPVSAETITAYESGIKASLIDRTLTANITGFYNDYRGVQASGSVATAGGGAPITLFINVGNAKIYGMEAELTARPDRFLTVNLGLGLLDATIKAPADRTFNGVPLNGNRLPMSPKVSLNGSIDWDRPIGSVGSLLLGADFNFQSDVFFGPDNLPTEQQKAYGVVNARIGWRSPSKAITVEAFAKNLLDTVYTVHAVDLGDFTTYHWGRQRTFGVRLSTRL